MRRLLLLAWVLPAAAEEPALTMDAILVKPSEVPKGVKIVEGIHCVSPQARTFFDTPSIKEIAKKLTPEAVERFPKGFLDSFPVPKRKECQSFQAEGRPAGSIMCYEYEAEPEEIVGYLPGYIWGDRRSELHPEEIVAEGRFIWVLSFPFPRGDPAAEWYKDRLRKKLRVHAERERADLIPLGQQIYKAYNAHDIDGGLKILRDNAKVVEGWSFGQYFVGEFATMKKDFPLAEKGYRRALELHESCEDPLDPGIVFASLDGLGVAILVQGRYEEAVKTLERAVAAVRGAGEHGPESLANTKYNLACGYARLKRYPEALAALKISIELNPAGKEMAKTDEDLAEAVKRPEFRELLK